jgi:hypothetical protein
MTYVSPAITPRMVIAGGHLFEFHAYFRLMSPRRILGIASPSVETTGVVDAATA